MCVRTYPNLVKILKSTNKINAISNPLCISDFGIGVFDERIPVALQLTCWTATS